MTDSKKTRRWNRKIVVIINVIYLVLLAQFVYSNTVHTIGPSVLMVHDESAVSCQQNDPMACIINCPNEPADVPIRPLRQRVGNIGFPVQHHVADVDSPCEIVVTARDAPAAFLWNVGYFVSVTAIAAGLLLALGTRKC